MMKGTYATKNIIWLEHAPIDYQLDVLMTELLSRI